MVYPYPKRTRADAPKFYPGALRDAMADPPIITYPAANWSDRNGQAIVAIVVHGTGGPLKSSLQALQTGDGRGVSIHVLIAQDGTLYRMLQDERGANHAGARTSSFTLHGKTYTGGAVNRTTLGVELVNLQDGRDIYPPAQLSSLGWLIAAWRAAYGPLPILRHGDLDPTRRRDPYQLTTNTIEIWAAKAAGATLPPAPPTDPWEAWGDIARPEGDARTFAVPRAWLANKVLGRCVVPETYAASGRYSVAEFERGIVYYLVAKKSAEVVLF